MRTGHRTTKTAMVAHADDVTVRVTAPADIQTIGDLLLTYEWAKGAYLSPKLWRKARGTHSGHSILRGNKHTFFQIYEHGCPLRASHLAEGDREGQSLGERA
jgi:hypothetical protein